MMKLMRSVFVAGLAVLGLAGAAHAGNVSVSIGLGVPGPVYYAPAPVYYEPAPVYYSPPPRVVYQPAYYVRPAPVYYETYVYAPRGKHKHHKRFNKAQRYWHYDD